MTFLDVTDAERTFFSSERSAAQLLGQRMQATVQLIKALGGGWGNQGTEVRMPPLPPAVPLPPPLSPLPNLPWPESQQMDARKWIAVAGTMLGAFMAVLDIQITNSSLADISGGIAATPDEGSWISTSYLIGEIITIPLTAWLSGFSPSASTCSATSCCF